jgi:hypothetical protein
VPDFARPAHRLVVDLLHGLNADLLARARCYFGGGTRLALAFHEYRESRDIDFLCSNPDGYALLRSEVREQSLGKIVRRKVKLAREVRADRDGIRTFFAIADVRIKFEILLEARIQLEGEMDTMLGVPALSMQHQVAEKFLANTDCGLDDSTLARDLVDLTFLAVHVDASTLRGGLELAERPYGSAVRRILRETLDRFTHDRRRSRRCIEALAVDDTATLRKGLGILRRLKK